MGSTTFRKRDLSRYMRVYPFVRRTPRYEYVADKPTRIENCRDSLEQVMLVREIYADG